MAYDERVKILTYGDGTKKKRSSFDSLMGLLFSGGFPDTECVTFLANMEQIKHTQGQWKHFTYKKCFKQTLYRRVMALDFRGSFILASLNSKRGELL